MTRDVTLDYFLLKVILVPVSNDRMARFNTTALCSKYQIVFQKILVPISSNLVTLIVGKIHIA